MTRTRIMTSAAVVAAALIASCPAEAQVIGPVSLFVGLGPGAIHARYYSPLGARPDARQVAVSESIVSASASAARSCNAC